VLAIRVGLNVQFGNLLRIGSLGDSSMLIICLNVVKLTRNKVYIFFSCIVSE